jgi:hypothetical protein
MALKDKLKPEAGRFFLALAVGIVTIIFAHYGERYLKIFADLVLGGLMGLIVYFLASKPFRNLRRERIRCVNCGRRFTIKIPVNNFITGFAKGDTQPQVYPNEKALLITHRRCGKPMYVFYRETPPLEVLAKRGGGR